MEGDTAVVANYIFRGIEYGVTMNMLNDNELQVEVEDRQTTDQWRGKFDTAYIEEVTHKTGNFKQFSVFTSMLESAILQTSDSVGLDLLTYSDLESLRNRKAGNGSKSAPTVKSSALNTKRYLILTYTVEFDRIHYPLPLPYMGKPDPRSLQQTIRQLQQQIKTLKQQINKDFKQKELEKLKKDYAHVQEEYGDLEAEFVEYRRQIGATSKGNAAKEVRALKAIIKNLEQDLAQERTKHQKVSSKRSQQYRRLADEVEDLRASERTLRVRVKSLTNELALYKRRPVRSTGNVSTVSSRRDTSLRNSRLRDRSSSRESAYSHASHKSRGRERSLSNDRSMSGDHCRYSMLSRDKSGVRSRSASRESLPPPNRWSRNRSEERNGFRSRTPSPSASGTRYPRFDPTAYIREKERLRKDADSKGRHQRGRRRSASRENRRPPTSLALYVLWILCVAAGSVRSRTSSVDSLSDIAVGSDSSRRSARNRKTKKPVLQPRKATAWSSPDVSYTKPKPKSKAILASTPEHNERKRRQANKENYLKEVGGDSDYFDRSVEISEIDARLNRLQDFMKTNLV
ncbi:hypothetical protein NP493_16g07017 [Ridgeia piscesae]|uniref:Centrosomal protein CCDC61 n=1 Tax=Ridgeia piscesae TaxID=27915 RepID=A0AAD9PEX4_RIDPI|nr:hypothetical protein NP493_16g07017 [Ridgeia piscesae]